MVKCPRCNKKIDTWQAMRHTGKNRFLLCDCGAKLEITGFFLGLILSMIPEGFIKILLGGGTQPYAGIVAIILIVLTTYWFIAMTLEAHEAKDKTRSD
jgi:hypothetical protein